jgi:hypothetical protein
MCDAINQSVIDDRLSEKALRAVFSEAMFCIEVRTDFSLTEEQHGFLRLGVKWP